MQKIKFTAITVLAFTLSACNGGKNQTNIELMQGMMEQISVKAQDWDPKNPNMSTGRIPPEGTVPRGFAYYKYKGDPVGAETNLKNPLDGDFSPETVSLGKAKFDIYCAVCHGDTAKGDGTVAAKMPLRPPPLISDKVKAFKDGRIFHIITDGQGVMGSYWNQIRGEKERWAVVNYIRTLGKKSEASSN